MVILKALFICKNLLKAIAAEEIVQGRVHSVFKNACNIEASGKFITLLSNKKNMAPMSILIDSSRKFDFKKLNITQNLYFNFNVNHIYCSERNLFIRLDEAQKWSPHVSIRSSNITEKELANNIKIMEIGLNTHGKLYGIGPLVNVINNELPNLKLFSFKIHYIDESFKFIKNRFLKLIRALEILDIDEIAQIGGSIIGFGSGLTPAVDDFISGLMICFIYLGYYYKLNISLIYEFNSKMISEGINKTTKVSSEMLKHSSIGETNEAVRELMESILYYHDEEKINKAVLNIISYGETSGTDTALGIYVGCKFLTTIKYRRVYENEVLCRYQEKHIL